MIVGAVSYLMDAHHLFEIKMTNRGHSSIPHGLPTSRLGEEKKPHELQSMKKRNLSPLQKKFRREGKMVSLAHELAHGRS